MEFLGDSTVFSVLIITTRQGKPQSVAYDRERGCEQNLASREPLPLAEAKSF